jgi:hypothetical protein
MKTGKDTYYVKSGSEPYADFTTKWNGLAVLSIENFMGHGEPKGIFMQEWVDSDEADIIIPDKVLFKTAEVNLNFIVRDFHDRTVDVILTHENFINYMTSRKVNIKSLYVNMENTFVCLKEYNPTNVVVNRGAGSNYIMGTLTLTKVNGSNTII